MNIKKEVNDNRRQWHFHRLTYFLTKVAIRVKTFIEVSGPVNPKLVPGFETENYLIIWRDVS